MRMMVTAMATSLLSGMDSGPRTLFQIRLTDARTGVKRRIRRRIQLPSTTGRHMDGSERA